MSELDNLFDNYDADDTADSATCQRCGEEDLHWETHHGESRLYDESYARHICKPDTEGFTAL